MAKVYTPAQAAAALRRFDQTVSNAVIRGMKNGLKFSLRYSVTERFAGGGKKAPVRPDKLTIRSGDLRRTVKIIQPIKSGSTWVGGLQAGGGPKNVRYAAIHEFGGLAGRRQPSRIRKRKRPFRRSRIPARPYLRPALEKTAPQIEAEIRKSVEQAAIEAIG